LPGPHFVQDRIGDGRDEGRGHLCAIQLFQMPLDFPGREPTRIQVQHLGIKALQAPLALGHHLGREAPVAIAWHLQVQRPSVRLHGLLALAVAGVRLLGAVAHVGSIAQVGGQLGFQHALHHPFGQLLEQPMLSKDVARVGIIFEQFV